MKLTPSPIGAIEVVAVVAIEELLNALDIYGDDESPLAIDSLSLPSVNCC